MGLDVLSWSSLGNGVHPTDRSSDLRVFQKSVHTEWCGVSAAQFKGSSVHVSELHLTVSPPTLHFKYPEPFVPHFDP